MPIVSNVVFTNIFVVPVEAALSNVLFDLVRILAVEGVTLCHQVVEAASEGPDVNFLVEVVFGAVLQNFRCRVVEVTAEALVLQQFLEIVGHADQVQLDDPVVHVNPRWMHVPENLAQFVHMVDAFGELPEY